MGWTTYQLVRDFFHQQYHIYTDEKCFERGERDIFNKIVARLYMGNLASSRETTLPIERTRCSRKLCVNWVFSKYASFHVRFCYQDSLSKIFKNQQKSMLNFPNEPECRCLEWQRDQANHQGSSRASHSFISKAKFNESFPENQTIQLNSSCKSFKIDHGMSYSFEVCNPSKYIPAK